MAYDRFGRTPEQAKRQRTEGLVSLVACLFLLGVILLALSVASCTGSTKVRDDAAAYDYAGPDGTLTGVPYQLRNYVVVDHDTGVYYFLIQDPKTGDLALCPRLDADGGPWNKPTYERGE